MQTANEIVIRAKLRQLAGSNLLPLINAATAQERQDATQLKSWLIRSGLSEELSSYLDTQLPGWRSTFEQRQLAKAREIVARSSEFILREDEIQINAWRMQYNKSRLPTAISDYLNQAMPGWRMTDEDKQLARAREIVGRANLRSSGGGHLLPQVRQGQQNVQETKDAFQLDLWKQHAPPSAVSVYLDTTIPSWRGN